MRKTGKFSDDQWKFLSVMSFFESPVSIDILGTLRPLPPSELRDLLERGNKSGIIRKIASRTYSIEKDLPSSIKKRIEDFYLTENISPLLQQIESMNLLDRLSPSAYASLLARSEKDSEAAQAMVRSAMDLLENGRSEMAYDQLKQALSRLYNHLGCINSHKTFIDATLEFSKLCSVLESGVVDCVKFLEQAKISSEILGNKRAWALSNLHLAFFYRAFGRKLEASRLFSIGQAAVEALEDQDIRNEASTFFAYYSYMRGNYKQAIELVEQAESNASLSGKTLSGITIFIKSYSLLYLGRYYLALGYIKSQWKNVPQVGQHAAANLFRAALGTFLIFINRYDEAFTHLNIALKQSYKDDTVYTRYIAKAGLAFLHYRKKNYHEAYLMMIDMFEEGKHYGISEAFTSPWILEMLVDFEKLGYTKTSEMASEAHLLRIMEEPNRHLQGVSLRLLVAKAFLEGKEDQTVWMDLKKSEGLLQEVGDPVQLAKTHLAMAIFKLKKGEKDLAYRLANDARYILTEYGEDFFPDGFHPLLMEEYNMFEKGEVKQIQGEVGEAFYAMISELPLPPKFEQGLEKLLMACNRFFSAEQGAVFWTDDGGLNNLYLRTPYNIGPIDKDSQRFINNMHFIKQALKKNQPIREDDQITKNHSRVGSILCIPFHTASGAAGVIWHANSYMVDCFSFLHENQLAKICDYLSNYISNIFEFSRQIEAAKESTLKKAAQIDSSTRQQFIIRGAAMTQVINQAKIIAEADSAVLILGETGVGKELLARWIHSNSKRSHWPIVTIDCTTVPETLIESELFGYEKGSFTGADRKKIGQIELADKGTLFIDEIGEIPLNIQVKLLRLLQEKKFKRIGGHQMIASDFRLIAATNRKLLIHNDINNCA